MSAPIRIKKRIEVLACIIEHCTRPAQVNDNICGICKKRIARGGSYELPTTSTSIIDSNGYERWYKNHPQNYSGTMNYAHKLVMENYLGRKLKPHENVHHLNGNRADNRLKNLELWSSSQPRGQRVKDKLQWAREILLEYGEIS